MIVLSNAEPLAGLELLTVTHIFVKNAVRALILSMLVDVPAPPTAVKAVRAVPSGLTVSA
jgi:hypothetical protein